MENIINSNQNKNDHVDRLANDIESDKNNNIILQSLRLDILQPYKNHPFKPYNDKRLDDMVQSIHDNGVMVPIIVRPIENNMYEILSGHNRVNAAKVLKMELIPAVIRNDLTDNEAEMYVIETNLIQRSFSDMCHSERAKTLEILLKAIKHQGKRIELLEDINELLNINNKYTFETSSPVANKLTSIAKIGKMYSLSKDTIARYIRINKLIEPHKERLDNGKLSFRAAVALSYLSNEEQSIVDEIQISTECKISMENSEALKVASQNKTLNREYIEHVLIGIQKAKTIIDSDFRLNEKILSKYFTKSMSSKEIENTILNALDYYFIHNINNQIDVKDTNSNNKEIESYH